MASRSSTSIQQLFEFCITGDRIGLADYIITNKCNPSAYDARDSKGQTALHIACQYGHLFVVKSLIKIFGCSPQIRDVLGNLPIHYACQHGMLPIVDYLFHFRIKDIKQAVFEVDSEGSNLLHKACQSGSAPVVRYVQEILCYNSKFGVPRKLNLYYDSIAPYDMSSLSKKKFNHNTRAIVHALLAENEQGDTPLHVACRHGHLAIVKIFKSYLPFMKRLNLALIATRCNHIDLARYIHGINTCIPVIHIDSESLICLEEFDAVKPIEGEYYQYLSLKPLQFGSKLDMQKVIVFTCFKCCKSYSGTIRLSRMVCPICKGDLSFPRNISQTKSNAAVSFSLSYFSCLEVTALSGNSQMFQEIEAMPYHIRAAACSRNVLTTRNDNYAETELKSVYIEKMLNFKPIYSFDSSTLHSACISDNIELVKHIMESLNCGPNVLDPHGNTPLHIACEWGSQNVFKLLSECEGVKKNVRNKKMLTPLQLACKHGWYNCCELLLTDAECISLIANEETPLHLACASNNVTPDVLARFSNSISVVNSVDQYGDTPIFNACRCGNLAVVQFLLEKGSDPLFVNHLTKETPVHIACRMGRHSILEALLVNSPITKVEKNSYNVSPIQLAVESGCKKTLLVLVKSCSNQVLNSVLNDRQQTLAHVVCSTGDTSTTEFLVKQDINWNAQDVNGDTSLHLACWCNYIEIVKIIIPHCMVLMQDNIMLWTPIHIASQNGFIVILEVLLKEITESLDDFIDKNGNTPLHLACTANSQFPCEVAKRLLKYCSLSVQNKEKSQTPIHIACESGHFNLIKLLLNSLNIDNLLVDSELDTILHVVIKNKSSLQIVTAVADIVQPVHKNNQGETPIHIACRYGDLDIIQLLVSKAAEIVLTDKGDSYLHSACSGKSLEAIEYLTEKSELDFAQLMRQNSDGNTPLHCACITGDHDIVCYLMERVSEDAHIHNKKDLSPFSCLLVSKHYEIVRQILSKKHLDKAKWFQKKSMLQCIICYLENLDTVFDLLKFIENGKISYDLKCDSEGNTILHSFLLQFDVWLSSFESKPQTVTQRIYKIPEIWCYLLTISGIQICCCKTNSLGDTPLHIVVRMVSKYSQLAFSSRRYMLIEYLDRAISIDRNFINYKNVHGKTAIQLARRDIIQILIKYGANPEDVIDLYGNILSRSKKDRPLNPRTKIVVLGNSEAGKSTLVQTIKSLDLSETQQNQLVQVTRSTAGINTSGHTSDLLGCVTFHDFGGQPQFESGNAVFLNTSVSIDYPPLFLVVADISQTNFVKQIQYWFSYIRDNTPVQLTPHIIIIGSHSDCILESDHQTVKELINSNAKCHKCHIANLFLMDCREIGSKQVKLFRQALADSSIQLRSSVELDCRCHVLIAYLSQWCKINSEVIKFEKIKEKISNNSNSYQNVLPVATHVLLDLLKSLHSGGYITLLNPEDLDHCWVILDPSLLYEKLNGFLFAPNAEKFDVPKLPTNIGVISSGILKSVLVDINIEIDLIISYIAYAELGQVIEDRETVKLILSACSGQDHCILIQEQKTDILLCSTETAANEFFLFFPSLVKNELPTDIWSEDEDSLYPFCWYMKCTRSNQFLSQRFLQVLLLRLTFNFVTLTGSPIRQLRGKCNIWKCGIHWSTKQGVEVLVEVIEQNSAVVLLTKFTEGLEIEGVKFRSELIKKIFDIKSELCPNTEVVEFLFPQTLHYPINTQAASVAVVEVANSITKGEPCVIDSKSKRHKLSKLLFFEPFLCNLEWLWSEEDQNKEITPVLITEVCKSLTVNKEMSQRSEELVQQIKSSTSLTYEALRKLIGRYSIFNGQNPFNLAKIQEPNPELYKEHYFKVAKKSPVSSQDVSQVQHQLVDKTVQADSPELSLPPYSLRSAETFHMSTSPLYQSADSATHMTSIATEVVTVSHCPVSHERVTVEYLQQDYCIDDEQLNRTVTKSDVNKLSKLFGDVNVLLPGLDLLSGQEADVRSAVRESGNEIGVNKALNCWLNTYTANFRKLIKITLDRNDASVARGICKYLKKQIK